MKSVGQLLQQARRQKKLSLLQVSKSTKISLDYLKKIEAGDFKNLPTATFVKGFIQNYARVVGVNPGTALATFRRDYDSNERGQVVPRGLAQPLKTPSKFYNPRTTTIIAAAVLILLIAAYLVRQLFIFTGAPAIKLTGPADGDLTGPIVQVIGSTSPDATITVNQQPVALRSDGSFQTTLNLSPGEHTIIIESRSRDNKTRSLSRTITVEDQ